MAERAVFLDRDNTIIDNDGYLGDPSKVRLLPGAATALSAIRALGYRLIVVSNQSGVARGMFTETDVEAVNQEMCRQLRDQAGAHIDASYYCPYHPEAVVAEYKLDHDWRKPKPGMLQQAAVDFGLDLFQCWMIGDQPRDIAAGAAADCRTILLRDPDHAQPDAETPNLQSSPSFIVKTLADAARIVAREGKIHHPPMTAPEVAPPSPAPEPAPAPSPAPPPVLPLLDSVPPAVAPVRDDDVLAEKVAQRLAHQPPSPSVMSSSRLERTLDELVVQLRMQHRNAELRPEFSRVKAAAMLVQIFTILALVAGFYFLATAGATLGNAQQIALVTTNLQRAMTLVMIAAVLQGLVIALLLVSRES